MIVGTAHFTATGPFTLSWNVGARFSLPERNVGAAVYADNIAGEPFPKPLLSTTQTDAVVTSDPFHDIDGMDPG